MAVRSCRGCVPTIYLTRGGGSEFVNLFPDLPSQTVRGVTYTRTGVREWALSGIPQTYSSAGVNVDLKAGVYRLSSTITANVSGYAHVQVQTPDGWNSDRKEFTLSKDATCRCQIACNDPTSSVQVDATISDVSLIRIDEDGVYYDFEEFDDLLE